MDGRGRASTHPVPCAVAPQTTVCRGKHGQATLTSEPTLVLARAKQLSSGEPEESSAFRTRGVRPHRSRVLPSLLSTAVLLCCLAGLCQGRAIVASNATDTAPRTPETNWRRWAYDEPLFDDDDDTNYLAHQEVRLEGDVLVETITVAAQPASSNGQEEESTQLLHTDEPKTKSEEEHHHHHHTRQQQQQQQGEHGKNQRREYAWKNNMDVEMKGGVEQQGRHRRGMPPSGVGMKWEGATIPFAFDKALKRGRSEDEYEQIRKSIRKAMRVWEDNTCIRFVPCNKNVHKNWIVFKPPYQGKRCSSFIGRRYGAQPILLGRDCQFNMGIIMHELGHAIGFFHEQKRYDRDRYVKILWKNILPDNGSRAQFRIDRSIDNIYNQSYDIDSIMHYMSYSLTRDPELRTIQRVVHPSIEIGQRQRLSPKDIARTNMMYRCPYPEQCLSRTHPIRSERLVSLIIEHTVKYDRGRNLKHKTKWLSCRRRDGLCRPLNCGSLAETDCNARYPTHCGSELFVIEREPGRLANHKIYANSPVMFRAHVQPRGHGQRRRRRSNGTRHGFLTCPEKHGIQGQSCSIIPCESNDPYTQCPRARFFFLPARNRTVSGSGGRTESRQPVDDLRAQEISENTPVGLCQDKGDAIQCMHCMRNTICMLENCGTRQNPSRHCEDFFVQLRHWSVNAPGT